MMFDVQSAIALLLVGGAIAFVARQHLKKWGIPLWPRKSGAAPASGCCPDPGDACNSCPVNQFRRLG